MKVWVSLLPFVSLAFAGGCYKQSEVVANHFFKWPGSLQTQRFGVFNLAVLLHIKENCVILQTEKLLPYILCLSWHLQKAEQVFLKEELSKFKRIDAPSLKVISKSLLATMKGLEAVYKM